MSQVNVTINGRQYRMACEQGQEGHLMRLAQELDGRITMLHSAHGEIGDSRLTVMAALTVLDELQDAMHRIRRLEDELSGLQDARLASADRAQATQAAIAAAFNAASERIERLARALNPEPGSSIAAG